MRLGRSTRGAILEERRLEAESGKPYSFLFFLTSALLPSLPHITIQNLPALPEAPNPLLQNSELKIRLVVAEAQVRHARRSEGRDHSYAGVYGAEGAGGDEVAREDNGGGWRGEGGEEGVEAGEVG